MSQTELVRRMEAQAALKRPTNFDMASESKDTQLRALERAVIDECLDKEALILKKSALYSHFIN